MRRSSRWLMRVAVLGAVVAGAGCGEASLQAVAVDGAGQLPAPLARAWSQEVAGGGGPRVRVRPLGSAEAVRALGARRSSLAIVAEPLDAPRQRAARGGALVYVPLVLSPVAVAYELKKWRQRDVSIASGIRFDTATLAVMFRAQIWSWISERILGRNDVPEIPDEIVQVCHRSDPAATTAAFTGYMSRRSSWWREGPGAGERVVWDEIRSRKLPTIFAARGDAGMPRCLKRTAASIGYLDAADARRAGISVARVVNREGRYVGPTVAGAQAAARSAELPDDLRFSLLDAPGAGSYPITSVRFAVVPRDLCAAGTGSDEAAAVRAWLVHALGEEGQRTAARLGYAPLPERIRAAAEGQVARLACDGEAIE